MKDYKIILDLYFPAKNEKEAKEKGENVLRGSSYFGEFKIKVKEL